MGTVLWIGVIWIAVSIPLTILVGAVLHKGNPSGDGQDAFNDAGWQLYLRLRLILHLRRLRGVRHSERERLQYPPAA